MLISPDQFDSELLKVVARSDDGPRVRHTLLIQRRVFLVLFDAQPIIFVIRFLSFERPKTNEIALARQAIAQSVRHGLHFTFQSVSKVEADPRSVAIIVDIFLVQIQGGNDTRI